MEEYVLETKELTKEYKYATALDHVNLHLKRGHIYGFIGNNGAGKTTLMRLIMGLAFADSGELMLFGEGGQRALERQRRRIGARIEQPVAYDNMSARQNLIYERMISLSEKKKDVDGLLEKLHISRAEVGNGPIRSFSVGMRQRYGIAAALLGEPEFLVLDEPTSGLDPAGTKDLRELFLSLNREKGTTMLISSHILSELHQVATDFIIINRGKILRELTHEELERERAAQNDTLDEYFLKLVAKAEGRA